MNERLEIRTLGGLSVLINGQPVTGFDSRKVPALLVYLACTEHSHPREVLAEMLWEERTQAQALSNLRVALNSLRQTVNEHVAITRESVSLREGSTVGLDAREFEQRLNTAGSDLALLQAALALYRGDFLAGFFVDSSAFEQWATQERERLRLRAMDALDRLAAGYTHQGDFQAGIATISRLLQMDPLREETHRLMMRVLLLSGQRGKALEQYETCRRLLHDEMGIEPAAETIALYERIRAGEPLDTPPPQTTVTPSHVASAPTGPLTNPYKGLRAFQEADASDFFGREALTERLVARMAEDGPYARFLAVVGPSGCGKSSVVRAGLIPALRGGALPGSQEWPVIQALPGPHPFDELDIALARLAGDPSICLLDELKRDTRGLLRVTRRVLPEDTHGLLLVIDQFEEVFTLVADPAEAKFLLDSLYASVTEPRSPLRVVITLRADFYDRPLMYPEFSEMIRQRTEAVVPLTTGELERAISGPAERVGVALESGLATIVVAEVSEQPGALPLLQYALTELFDQRTDHTLTLEVYREIGGALGALARRADAVYRALAPEAQTAARQVCLRLVTLGEGTEDIRRRSSQDELLAAGGESTQAVLDAFDRSRLLTFDLDTRSGTPTVELAHEAIIREWGRLRTWLDESRGDVRLQRLLAIAAGEWNRAGRDSSYLLTGSRLAQFTDWAEQTSITLTPDERAFVEASTAERLRQRARRRRVRTTLLTAALVIAAVMTVLALFALNREQRAQDARATSEANSLLAETQAMEAQELALINGAQASLAQGDMDTALALAMAANRSPDPPAQAQVILAKAAYPPGTRRVFGSIRGDRNIQIRIAISPDGRLALFGGTDSTSPVSLWNIETGELVHNLQGHTAWVEDVGFSPDGRTGFSIAMDRTIIIWDLETGKLIRRFGSDLIASSNFVSATYSPDGRYILSNNGLTNEEGVPDLILWDASTGGAVRTFSGHNRGPGAVAISPDGRTALSVAGLGEMILWDLETGAIIQRFGEISEDWRKMASDLVFRPDGHSVVVMHFDSTVSLWDLDTFQAIRHFGTPQEQLYGGYQIGLTADGRYAISVNNATENIAYWDLETGETVASIPTGGLGMALSRDGALALTGDGDIRTWELTYGPEIRQIDVGEPVFYAALSPDGRKAVTTTGEQQQCDVTSFDMDTGEMLWKSSQIQRPYDPFCMQYLLGFSPDSRLVLVGGEDDRVSIVDMETGNILRVFPNHIGPVITLASSPDGRTMLSADMSGLMLLWDVETLQEIRHLTGHQVTISNIVFSPDGQTAVSTDSGGLIIMWDILTGKEIRRIQGPERGIVSLAYTSDGRAIVGNSPGGEITWWDTQTGQVSRVFRIPTGAVESGAGPVAFTGDGRWLLAGFWNGGEGSTALLDTSSGEIVRIYPKMLVALNSDGHSFLVTGGTGLQLLRIDTHDELVTWTLEHRHVRELTCDERDLYHIEPLCDAARTYPTRTPYPAPPPVVVSVATTTPLQSATLELSPTPSVTPHPALIAQTGANRGEVAIGNYQVWQYAGRAGERLTIRVSADHPANWDTRSEADPTPEGGWLDTLVIVTAPDGTDMNIYEIGGEVMYDPGESQDIVVGINTDSLIEHLTLPEDGTYLITVTSSGYQGGGAYTMTLESQP